MLKLCGFHISNYHNKVRIALLEKGVPFEEDPSCSPCQEDELRARAKFDPYIAGAELSLADCTAFVSLPLVSLATKHAYGRDFLEEIAQLKPYLKMLEERPAFRQVNADRKAATAGAKK